MSRSGGRGGGRRRINHPHSLEVPSEDQQETKKNKKIPVVYYLCRNRHLDHPHFIEVSVSSSSPGLFLRDVLDRLATLRGARMASLYAWSCKRWLFYFCIACFYCSDADAAVVAGFCRSYKNGFVWQDLSEDDLVFANNGDEYVLKGSEIFFSENATTEMIQPATVPPTVSLDGHCPSEKKETLTTGSSSSSSFSASSISSLSSSTNDTGRGRRDGEEPSPGPKQGTSEESGGDGFCVPPDSVDAFTQTDEASRGSLSTTVKEALKISPEEVVLNSSTPPVSSSGHKAGTLESLIRADAQIMNGRFRIIEAAEEEEEENEDVVPTTGKLKATEVLIQLITCGSISVKDHKHRQNHLGFIPTYYKPNFPSPTYTDYLSESSRRFMGLRFEEKEYFSGSFLELKKKTPPDTKAPNEQEEERNGRTLKRCSSDSGGSKCLPRTMVKTKTKKESTTEGPTRSPRISSDGRRSRSSLQKSDEGVGNMKKLVKIEER